MRDQGFHVLLTRKDDATVTVEQRVHKVNTCDYADLLVSVHANSGSPAACGIETYCIHQSGFFAGTTVLDAAGQSFVTACDTKRYHASEQLARSLQCSVLASTQATDRGVRHAITRLLLGVEMPAVLVEMGYLSNKAEVALLTQASYQQKLAQGICAGVVEYFNMH